MRLPIGLFAQPRYFSVRRVVILPLFILRGVERFVVRQRRRQFRGRRLVGHLCARLGRRQERQEEQEDPRRQRRCHLGRKETRPAATLSNKAAK